LRRLRITGAARGIGLAFARHHEAAGWVLDRVTPADSGRLFNHSGEPLPWWARPDLTPHRAIYR